MKELVVLRVRPKEYLFNGPSNCGVYVAKGILSAYERDIYPDPRDYHQSSLARKFGWTLVSSLMAILQSFRIKAQKKFAHGTTDDKIELLKFLLRKGNPVVLNIGSCYEIPYRWFTKIVPHWVTIWGYDETDFFLYDSSVPLEKQNSSIPIGNRKIEHQDLIWFWGAAYWFKIREIFGRRYLYLTIKQF